MVVDIKNTVSGSSSNIDEAHETGLSHVIFLMCFSCAEKNEEWKEGWSEKGDGRRREVKGDLAGKRLLTAEEDRPHPLVGRLQRQRGQAEGRRHDWKGKHQGAFKEVCLHFHTNRKELINTNVKRK